MNTPITTEKPKTKPKTYSGQKALSFALICGGVAWAIVAQGLMPEGKVSENHTWMAVSAVGLVWFLIIRAIISDRKAKESES